MIWISVVVIGGVCYGRYSFLPRQLFCFLHLCIKCSRVNMCTSMCDMTLVCAVQAAPAARCMTGWWSGEQQLFGGLLRLSKGGRGGWTGQSVHASHQNRPQTYGDEIRRSLKLTEIYRASSELGLRVRIPFYKFVEFVPVLCGISHVSPVSSYTLKLQ